MSEKKNEDKNQNSVQNYLYASDKERLQGLVKDMSDNAAASIEKAVHALKTKNIELAQKVIDGDDLIDEKEEQVDQECLYSIAMRQPVREDLRFVYSVMKIIVDLERIGDQSVNIAMNVMDIPKGFSFPEEIVPLAEDRAAENIGMIQEVMKAFAGEDETVICRARERRKKIKDLRRKAVSELDDLLESDTMYDSDKFRLFCTAILVLRHLSRISDHALNLAERVSFIATGISPLTLKRAQEKIDRL
ncbi:MAG: phosphate signaling complex protein PhoU [Synergistaceae bacterium]|nr:phosphate signaling complex protein PhoU [Synergistaceae bacterium]